MDVSHASLHSAPEQQQQATQEQQQQAQAYATNEATVQIVNPWLERYEQYWKAVQQDPEDFTMWTNLLTTAEQLDDGDKVRQAFDAFLIEYPLCYGYWKKYADSEVRLGDTGRAETIYERGLASIPYSADLWAHYAEFTAAKKDIQTHEVKGIFERGLAYVASDFHGAHVLWDKLVEYETKLGDTVALASTYSRILRMPIKMLDKYYTSFKEFAQGRKVDQLIPEETSSKIRVRLQDKKREEQDEALEEGEEIVIPDEDIIQVWMDEREGEVTDTKKKIEERRPFEEGIRRPYFHVKSLDSAQLLNWCRYLDWMEGREVYEETVMLYERCLIACALYSDFWRRYVRYLESKDVNSARNALKRATEIHCKRKPEMHVFAGCFYERHDEQDLALNSFKHASQPFSSSSTPSLEAIIALASYQNRHQGQQAAQEVFENSIQQQEELLISQNGTANGDISSYQIVQEASQIYPFLVIQFAHFCRLIIGDFEKAEGIYERGLKHLGKLKVLWEGAIHLQETRGDQLPLEQKIQQIVSLYRRACRGDHGMSESDRYELWKRWDQLVKLTGTREQIEECENLAFKIFPSTFKFTLDNQVGSLKRSSTDSCEQPAAKAAKIVQNAQNALNAYSSMGSLPAATASAAAVQHSMMQYPYWPTMDQLTQQQQQYYYGYDYSMYGYGAYSQAGYTQAGYGY
eukprot:TRINITY_DN2337_c0_g4_i1.p1 TRINITY_DN2337_c0_g4~~TRINITY_DN2337_c0_g4_i1.p1  ORF type:complete len:689 (-),score=100.22 TRINITY_DN2337_c0_g4_i1:257-2323(-)